MSSGILGILTDERGRARHVEDLLAVPFLGTAKVPRDELAELELDFVGSSGVVAPGSEDLVKGIRCTSRLPSLVRQSLGVDDDTAAVDCSPVNLADGRRRRGRYQGLGRSGCGRGQQKSETREEHRAGYKEIGRKGQCGCLSLDLCADEEKKEGIIVKSLCITYNHCFSIASTCQNPSSAMLNLVRVSRR